MRVPLTTHLPDAAPQERLDAWDDIEYVLKMPGWGRINGAIVARTEALQADLLRKPRETPQEYERIIGEMRGLASVEQLIAGFREQAEEARNG